MNAVKGLVFALKVFGIYVALIAGGMVGGFLLFQGVEPPEGFDAEGFQRAMLAINAAYALLMAVLASRSGLSRIGTAGLLFALLFGIQTVLAQMEAVFFAESLNYSLSSLPRDLAAGAVTAAFGAIAAALLFARPARDEGFEARSGGALAWRFALATALYPVAYWLAGLFIALQSEAVREFYGEHIDAINPATLLAFQVLRGAIWAGLALWAVNSLRGAVAFRAALVGIVFVVFMVAQLLYPNALMPEPVRIAHAIEMTVSNFIYGFVAALLLAPRPVRAAP